MNSGCYGVGCCCCSSAGVKIQALTKYQRDYSTVVLYLELQTNNYLIVTISYQQWASLAALENVGSPIPIPC